MTPVGAGEWWPDKAFRRLRARATPAAATQFRRSYYGRPVKPVDRRVPLTWASVPDDYDMQAWKRQARDGLGEVFSNGGERRRRDHESEVRELHAKIGELTVERDFLSRGSGR